MIISNYKNNNIIHIYMKVLIYSCVFFNEKYIDLINLLLKSYKIFGDPRNNIHYLIMCNYEFKNKIQNIFDNLKLNGKIWCLDLKTKFEAGCSRLKIFDYPHLKFYKKVLYLDTDILITNSIDNVLNFTLENKLYTLLEGNTNHDYWGAKFFNKNPNCSAFSSGILLFNNHKIIKRLFTKILDHIDNHIKNKLPIPNVLDQPFIVYNAINDNLYNNKKLINLAINNPTKFNGESISHFPGDVGKYEVKIVSMNNYMNNIMFNSYSNIKKNLPEIIPNKIINTILFEKKTMVSRERLINLYKHCNKFKNTNYSFVECGVAKGGCLALMKYIAGKNNKIFGFDSFDCKVGHNLSVDIQSVYNTFDKLNLTFHNVKLIKGFFENTLNVQDNIYQLEDVAVLRLDGDCYNSVKICLDKLYEKVIEGGVIIIDDYGHCIGAKNATDEFRTKKNIKSPLIQTDYTEFYWIKETESLKQNKNNITIHDDIWTCSDEFRKDIKYFFKDKSCFKIAEIGSHKGYTTRYLSNIFKKVYAVDNSVEWTNFNKNFNKDKTNIEYIHLDIYKESWNVIPDVDVVFIDAGHNYECCKSDIYNSLSRFKNLKYIIFDDYGVWQGVKKIVNECLINEMLLFETYIGLNDVIGPKNKIVQNTSEGIICKVNINIQLVNKKYKWQESYIIFLENYKMKAFEDGKYIFIDKYLVKCNFGNQEHLLKFNQDYSNFISIRKNDFQIVFGYIDIN